MSLFILFWVVCVMILLLAGDIEENPGPVNRKDGKCRSLSMCHVNIRSLSRSKLLAVQTSLADLYDIITISESHLHQGIGNDVFTIPGFHEILRKDRDGNGGGVAMYIRDNIAYKRHYEFESAVVEALWVSVQTIQGKVLLCCCYRPPNRTDFWDDFDTIIDLVKQSNTYQYMFILGDLNADLSTTSGNKLKRLCLDHNLQYMINEPTRIPSSSQTILDQILTNAPNFMSDISVSPPVSTNDHCTISARANFKIHKKEPFYRHIWLFKNADFNHFRQALMEADFSIIFEQDNIDDICQAWSDKFLDIANKHIPNRKILVRPNDSPWYSSKLRLMKRKMLRLFHSFKRANSAVNWEAYRQAQNEYQYALDKAEVDYKTSLTDSLSNSKNSKDWWRTVKSLLGKGSFRSLPVMKVNTEALSDSKDKAEAFNNFFLSHSNVDVSQAQLPQKENVEYKLVSVKASEQEVLDLLMSLDTTKATGPDGIGPKLLYEAGRSIVPSLTKLLNLCFSSSKVPQMWKHANVMPLFKKGDPSELNNYRSVSLLSCTSKIMERIVFKNVFNYMRDNGILSSHQSGFQSGDSTVNQLAYLYHVFSQALDEKKDVRIVFCDISKAFDRVWHDGLIFKLEKIGIGDLLNFFKHYLSNRTQSVIIDGQICSVGHIKAGVPQGSSLGPLLFLVYINDLTENIRSNIKLFADNTSLFINVEDPVQSALVLNDDLLTIKRWADQWLVNFSAEKTKLMTCSFRSIDHPGVILMTLSCLKRKPIST